MFLFAAGQIFVVQAVTVLAFESQEVLSGRVEVGVADEACAFEFTNFCELLQSLVHILGHLGAEVDVRLADDVAESAAQLDLLDGALEVEVNTVLVADSWVVQHFELLVIGPSPLISLVELVHRVALASESLNHKHAHLLVHQLEAAQKVKKTVLAVIFTQLLGVKVTGVLKFKALQVDLLKRVLDVLHGIRCFVRQHNDHTLKNSFDRVHHLWPLLFGLLVAGAAGGT